VFSVSARLFGRQVLRQRRVGQVAHPAEQVQLERRYLQAGLVGALDRRVFAHGAAVAAHAQAHRRQAVGAGDAVLRTRLLDVGDRHAQVAVVDQRGVDQRAQARIGEERLPGDRARRRGQHRAGRLAGRLRGFREGGGHRGRRAFIVRGQRDAAGQRHRQRQRRQEFDVLDHG